MSLVRDLTPINLAEEKKKFFESNFTYNPQFKYQALVTKKKLLHYGQPKPEYLEIAQKLLKKAFDNRTEQEIRELEGPRLNQKQVIKLYNQFVKQNQIQEEVELSLSDQYLGKASFYKGTFKLKLPIWHRHHEFLGTLYHELGTHAIRRINYAQQPFYKKKKKYGFKEYLFTEEGLASLHTLLARNFKIDYTGALNYVLTDFAQSHSFAETFAFTKNYIQDDQRAWNYTIKHKRGLYDTAKGGGFTKDLVYFEGLIGVWQYLQQSNFDLEGLYLGKISLEDIPKAREANPEFKPKLPDFITQNRKEYQTKITEVARINYLI
ncbi:MAG: DUF1704 domain-containing protein [Candidatus Pacebacteria bacterium]|nr:DUF1704 domain-containing protein [Candidatus Paceibacterota bacterium]